VVGVMVGVMALIIVLSVMNGFRADLIHKILGVNAHILVRNYGGAFNNYGKILKDIKGVEGVTGATPTIYSQVMVNGKAGASGAVLRGIDVKTVGEVIDIVPMIKEGSLSSLNHMHGDLPGIIIGTELSRQIDAMPGDILTLVSPEGRLTPLGRTPNSRKYRVTALFSSGMYEYDLSMVFVSLQEAQDFLGAEDRVTGIEVRVKDPYKSDRIGEAIEGVLGYPYWVQDWMERNKSLFSALKLEKITMFIILTMIVLVGALNIISTLVMVVMEKTRDIAILRAMGATKKSIMRIFMLQGLLVGLSGTVAGLAAGLGICQLIGKYIHIKMPTDFYGLMNLPVKVETMDVTLVPLAAVLLSFIATIYPSWRASKLNPVEALRYE